MKPDLTPKPRFPHEEQSRPKPEWARMGRYVHTVVMAHPGMQPLRDARKRFHVFCSSAWIGINAVPETGAGGFEITVQIAGDYWWQPLSRRHGNELAEELVRRTVEPWEGCPPDESAEANLDTSDGEDASQVLG